MGSRQSQSGDRWVAAGLFSQLLHTAHSPQHTDTGRFTLPNQAEAAPHTCGPSTKHHHTHSAHAHAFPPSTPGMRSGNQGMFEIGGVGVGSVRAGTDRCLDGKKRRPPRTCAARMASRMRSTPSYAKQVSSTSARIFSGCGVMRRLMFFNSASRT